MTTGLIDNEKQQPNPMSLLATAIERGVDADQLGKLVALQERYENRQAERLFAESMHACQQAMPKVAKDKKNTHTNSKYASLEAVQSTIRATYAEYGFSLSFGEADCPLPTFKRTVCDVRHMAGHCVRYHLDLPIDGTGARGGSSSMNAVQGSISTTSYGQRRLTCMIFNITLADEDDDGQCAACITEEQQHTLQTWLDSTGAQLPAFLKWAKAESLAKFPAAKYDDAIAFFQRKAKQ